MPFMVNRQGEAWYIPDVPDPMEPSSDEPDGPESETDENKGEHPGRAGCTPDPKRSAGRR